MAVLLGCTQAVALTMGVAFLAYVHMIVVPYLRHEPAPPGDSGEFDWHFLVPCRDEEAVIGATVRHLRDTFPFAHVWVIDDDSDDRTAEVVDGLRRGHGAWQSYLHLVRRTRPDARTGRGDALNAAYRELKHWLGRHTDVHRQIVVVLDANGRPAADCLDVCAGANLFGDNRIGAVQIDVRMSDRGAAAPGTTGRRRWLGTVLARMQDMEFRTAIAAVQRSGGHTGTISLGGNGQFARLSALDSVTDPRGRPWGDSPLTDFDLGVRLLTAGWRTGFSMDTHVDQEGSDGPRRFLARRVRRSLGTMRCARYARRIWDSRNLSTPSAVEMVYHLAQPWMRLFGTVAYPIPFVLLAGRAITDPDRTWHWLTGGAWPPFAAYGLFGVLPFLVWGPIYRWKCERRGGFLRAIGDGVCYAVYAYTCCVMSWPAVLRLTRERIGRAGTLENTELHDGVIALDI